MGFIADWVILIFSGAFLLILLVIAVMYIQDVTQTTHAIRRNYPVIGRMRYSFERLGGVFPSVFLCPRP